MKKIKENHKRFTMTKHIIMNRLELKVKRKKIDFLYIFFLVYERHTISFCMSSIISLSSHAIK